MTARNAMILMGAFLGLLTYVYFYEIAGEKKKQEVRQSEFERLKLERGHIEKIIFVESGIHVEKNDSCWFITKPFVTRADGSALNLLLDQLGSIDKARTISDNAADFAKFGVEDISSGFVLYGEDVIRDSIIVGDTNLDGTKVFCRMSNSNKVFLAPNLLSAFSKKTVFNLCDKRLLAFDEKEIRKLNIINEGNAFSCMKDSTQVWWLEGQVTSRCDQEKVNALISLLKKLKIVKFVPESKVNIAAYHLDSPRLSITVCTENESTVLHFSKQDNNRVFVRKERQKPIYQIDSTFLGGLNISDFSLREKTVVQTLPDSIIRDNKKENEADINFL